MKYSLIIMLLILFISCKNDKARETSPKNARNKVELGQELFEGKGNCIACHLVDKKVIGPSIQDIAKIYKTQNGNLINFLKNDAKPIVDPSQYELMKTNFSITKAMSDEELEALEAYIYSFL